MTKTLLMTLCILILTTFNLRSQNVSDVRKNHKHNGLFVSASFGPVFGDIKKKAKNNIEGRESFTYSGTGTLIDFKIGGAIVSNLLGHATITFATIGAPTVKNELTGIESKYSSGFAIRDVLYGAGLTYYIMPTNIFFSGSAGFGQFVTGHNQSVSGTDIGFGMQLKAGKEWWISKNWALGIGVSYSMTSVDTRYTTYDSNRYGVTASLSFN